MALGAIICSYTAMFTPNRLHNLIFAHHQRPMGSTRLNWAPLDTILIELSIRTCCSYLVHVNGGSSPYWGIVCENSPATCTSHPQGPYTFYIFNFYVEFTIQIFFLISTVGSITSIHAYIGNSLSDYIVYTRHFNNDVYNPIWPYTLLFTAVICKYISCWVSAACPSCTRCVNVVMTTAGSAGTFC